MGMMLACLAGGDIQYGGTYIGVLSGYSNTSTANLSTVGAQAGDLAVLCCAFGSSPVTINSGSGTVWTRTGVAGGWLFQRIINSADAGAGVSVSEQVPFVIEFIRGAGSVNPVANGTSSPVTGVSKAPKHIGFIAYNYTGNSGGLDAGTADTPATWSSRAVKTVFLPGPGIFGSTRLSDRLSPAQTYYVDGTAFGWTPAGAGSSSIQIIEVLAP